MPRNDTLFHWLMLAPALAILGVMLYWPMLGTVIESFHDSSFIRPQPRFVGFEVYERVFGGRDFPHIVRNSVVWTVAVVLLQNLLGLLAALLLNRGLPGQGMLRAIVLLPWVLPGVVAAIVWRFMYDPQLGLINSLLLRVGVLEQTAAWLADSSTAMAAAIFAAVWKGFPFSALIYLAALQSVEREQIEAATIDGAGPVRRLVDVTLPAIRGVIVVNIVLTTILTFNYFDMIWVLTRGGPQSATHIFPTKIYEVGFGQFRFGEAATYGVVSILVLAVLVAFYLLATRSTAARRRTA